MATTKSLDLIYPHLEAFPIHTFLRPSKKEVFGCVGNYFTFKLIAFNVFNKG